MHTHEASCARPLLLTIPGIDNSGPDHWQTIWERERDDCRRVDLGEWSRPRPAAWAERLNHAITATSRPIILVAHSLGCHAVGWWNAFEPALAARVKGALLVAPPDVEDTPIDPRLRVFGPIARKRLPFPSTLVASRNDPYASFGHARRMARIWGSRLVDAGPLGHINAQSGLHDWPYGLFLMQRLLQALVRQPRPLLAHGALATLQQLGVDPASPR